MEIQITATQLDDVLIVDTRFFRDERGLFIESYHAHRYQEHGISATFVQDNHSRSARHVLRGFHYQDARAPMGKLVRCPVGAILDVAVDLRVGAPTFGQWVAVELNEDNMRQLLVPPWCGHAFVALSEVADVHYKCTAYYTPEAEGAIAWDDPDVGVEWPMTLPVLSQRDQHAPSLRAYLEQPAYVYGEPIVWY
jgi:dTDP-4-dehydrorhamnose 3,5-epimerase